MKSFFAIALIALVAFAAVVSAQEVDVSTSLEGVWALEVAQTGAEAKYGATAELPIHLVANFSRRDGQLVGVVSSSDGSVNALIQLTPEGPRGGAFYLLGGSSSDEEFDAGAVLMTFDLNNNTGRTLVGSGEWVGIAGGESSSILSKPGFYQVSLLDQNVFIFNVVSGKHLITITATKTAAVGDDAPWWSKFGTPLLFVGAMSISRIVRGFFGEKKPEAGAPAAAGGAVAGGAKAKKD